MTKPRKQQASCIAMYLHLHRRLLDWNADNANASPEDKRRAYAKIVQSAIELNVPRCVLDTGRQGDPGRRRYAINAGAKTFYLKVPRSVSGRDVREMLEREMSFSDPDRPNPKERAQTLVDSWYGTSVTLGISCALDLAGAYDDSDPAANAIRNEITECGLVKEVAVGMANRISQQRPTIRQLGPETLKQMVTEILEDHLAGVYSPNAVARRYALEPSTLSHVAPKEWRLDKKLPDLWAYVVEVAKKYPALVIALREAAPKSIKTAVLAGSNEADAASASDIAPGIIEKRDILMDRLSGRSLGLHVDRLIALAPLDGGLDSCVCESDDSLIEIVSTHLALLLKSLGASRASASSPTVQGDAVALVERAFHWEGGFCVALADAKEGLHGGLRHVLSAMTEQFRRESRLKYAKRVYKEIAGPLSWEDRIALVRAFLAKTGPMLPAEIRSQRPERLARHFEILLDAHVKALDTVKELVRTL